jgi:plasmid stabilization system protein ParE
VSRVVPKIKRTPKAKQDLRGYVLYLAQISPDVADRFIDNSEATFEQLAQMPRLGKLQTFKPPELAGTRRWFIVGAAAPNGCPGLFPFATSGASIPQSLTLSPFGNFSVSPSKTSTAS